MDCKHCKHKLPLKAKYCPHCGSNTSTQKKERNFSALEFILDLAELVIDIVVDVLT